MSRATRRSLLALLGAGVLARPARAQGGAQGRTIVDSANRKVSLPDRVNRVFVAGPPGSVLILIGTSAEQDEIRKEMERDMVPALLRKIEAAERKQQ